MAVDQAQGRTTSAAMQRMVRARTALLLNNEVAWFGAMALNLRLVEDASVPVAATDGTVLRFNPSLPEMLTRDELLFVIAHEVGHCAFGHPWRLEGRDHATFNQAGDYALNGILVERGLTPPEGILLDPQYHGMAVEVIYERLMRQKREQAAKDRAEQEAQAADDEPQDASGTGQGDPDEQADDDDGQPSPGGEDDEQDDAEESAGTSTGQDGASQLPTGTFEAAPSGTEETASGEQPMTERDWQAAAAAATMMARKAGTMPGYLEEMIAASREPQADWRAVLHEFVQQVVNSDYSWVRPDRRFVGQGIYLPGVMKDGAPRLGVAVDTSGSVSTAMLDQFAAEITAILHDVQPEAIDVVFCDTRVNATDTFTPDDAEVRLTCKGRGGTAFQPALDWFAQADEPVAAIIYLTDLENSDEVTEPDMPVLWVTPLTCTLPAPFGQVVRIAMG